MKKQQIYYRLQSLLLALLMVITLFPAMTLSSLAATEVASGTCGTSVTWTLYDDGKLVITGTGPMVSDSSFQGLRTNYSAQIIEVIIEEGVTRICEEAFSDYSYPQCSNLTSVTMSSTVAYIEPYAFENCVSLDTLIFWRESPPGMAVGAYIFDNVPSSGTIYCLKGSFDAYNDNTWKSIAGLSGWTVSAELGDPSGPGDPGGSVTGNCGPGGSDSVKWTLYEDGKLIISGVGPMGDFGSGTPWASHGAKIQTVVVENGVTVIGMAAFAQMMYFTPNLTSITITASVSKIESTAFYGCGALNELTFIGDTPPIVGPMAFDGVTSSGTIFCPVSAMGDYNSWKNSVGLSGWTVNADSDSGTLTFPVFTSPKNMWLAKGYAATSTAAFTIIGAPEPVVAIDCANDVDGKITWNATTKKLDIATGLAPGVYEVELTATNDVGSDSTAFTLTVYWNEIPIDEKSVFFNNNIFNSWLINGAEIIDYTETSVSAGNSENFNRTFDIFLSSDTGQYANINIFYDMEMPTAGAIYVATTATHNFSNLDPLIPPGLSFDLEDGEASVTLYIHYRSSTADRVVTTNTFNFTIESNDPDPANVASIAITNPPNKTQYFDGNTFSRAGMVVTATLKAGGTVPVLGYTVTPNPLTLETTEVTVSFGSHTTTQAITVLPSMTISNVAITNGQLMDGWNPAPGSWGQKKANTFDAVVLYGHAKGNITFEVNEGVDVYIGSAQQIVADGKCTVQLDASTAGTATTVTLKQSGAADANYTFTCYTQQLSGMPSQVVEYLCIASQYTNAPTYGTNPVATLRAENRLNTTYADNPLIEGPNSLGNFGGYIIYYYDAPITDNPYNPYGIDFIVYGNSHNGSNDFAEPGNVLISEDGETWYTLAGSLHYDDCALWNYSMTYTRNPADGKSTIVSSDGTSGTGDLYPSPEYYPLFPWTEATKSQITLIGTMILPESGVNEYSNTLPTFPHFGYADCGIIGDSNQAYNPYLGVRVSNNSIYSDRTDGFDLKWAVDENGQPVDLSSANIHYVKVQAATGISNAATGEKSPEVHMVRVAQPAGGNVGVTVEPTKIMVGETELILVPGQDVYNNVTIPETGAFTVTITPANASANVYINGSRGTSRTFSKNPAHGMIRIIVQNGQAAPVIYYLNLTEDSNIEGMKYSEITFEAWGGSVNGKASDIVIYSEDMTTLDRVFPTPTYTSRRFLGWYATNGTKYEAWDESMPAELTLTARWEYVLSQGESPQRTVSFRLIGSKLSNVDVDLTGNNVIGYNGAEYVTWIGTRQYTVNAGDTVYDLFIKALADAKLRHEGADKNYVSAIWAPSSLGGYKLAEMTNGPYSGWMYTVNDIHVSRGLREWDLQPGDVVIFHYVNDYRYEISDWFDDPTFSAHGDGSLHSRWLIAPDILGGTGGGNPGGTTGGTTITPDLTTTISVTPTISGGKATGTVTDIQVADALKKTLDALADEDDDAIGEVKVVMDTKAATTATAGISGKSLKALAKEDNVVLTIETGVGSVTFDNDALTELSNGVGDTDKVEVTITDKGIVGGKKVYELTVKVGGETVLTTTGSKSEFTVTKETLKDDEKPPLTDWVNPFADVKESDWFYAAVKYANENGLMNGTSTTTFAPNATLTRAMLVTILYRYAGEPAVTGQNPFSDVAAGQWYTDAIIWANANGIVEGYGGGLFGTDDNITREQLAVILYRFAQKMGLDVSKSANLSGYTDADSISDWALDAMKWANANGLINGRTTTTLEPGGTATRAEAATILMRFLENVIK